MFAWKQFCSNGNLLSQNLNTLFSFPVVTRTNTRLGSSPVYIKVINITKCICCFSSLIIVPSFCACGSFTVLRKTKTHWLHGYRTLAVKSDYGVTMHWSGSWCVDRIWLLLKIRSIVFHSKYPLSRLYIGLILRLRPANERCRYFVTTSPIGWRGDLESALPTHRCHYWYGN